MKAISRILLALAFGLSVVVCFSFVQQGTDWRPIIWAYNAGWTFFALCSID